MLRSSMGRIAATLLVGLFAVGVVFGLMTRTHRTLVATTAVPAGAELAAGTSIVVDRESVGGIGSVDPPRWGVAFEARVPGALPGWSGRTALLGDSAERLSGPGAGTARLERTGAVVGLSVRYGASTLLLNLTEDGTWSAASPGVRGTGSVRVNGTLLDSTGLASRSINLMTGDLIRIGDRETGFQEIRLGRFAQYRLATLKLTTGRLCPRSGLSLRRWFPNAEVAASCRRSALGPEAYLDLAGTLGLTKPTLKLARTYGEGEEDFQATDRIPLIVKRGLQDEVSAMLDYLNSPVEARPAPVTHFEQTVTNVNRAVAKLGAAAGRIDTTVDEINRILRTDGGAGRLVLEQRSREALAVLLTNGATLTGRLADPAGTIVANAGLEPLLTDANEVLDTARLVLADVKGQVERLAPRVELAADAVTRSMDGVNGTLISVKQAAEDVTAIKEALPGKRTVIPAVAVVAVGFLAKLAAALKYVF